MSEKLVGPSVLALVGRQRTGPDLWRVLQPITALEKAGYWCGWDFKENHLIGAIAPAFDGYLLPRVSWPPSERRTAEAWFQSIRRAGKFAVYDADDDIFTPAETHRRVELDWTEGKSTEQLDAERHERIWAMQQCDGVTVSTQRLATIVRQYTQRPVIVVPNAIDLKWFQGVVRASKRIVPGLTIGWAGGRRHDRDVEQMAEAWGRIATRYPEVTFVVQGFYPDVIHEHVPVERIFKIPWLPLKEYPSGLRQIDIGCCAVADTPFNRPKSSIKAMEYAAAGAAVVASPTLYAGLVDHGSSGFIANDVGEWEDGLAQLHHVAVAALDDGETTAQGGHEAAQPGREPLALAGGVADDSGNGGEDKKAGGGMTDRGAWDRRPHEHCRCGSRLVAQPFDESRPVCLDCGYFDAECSCDPSACESCGREPDNGLILA